MQEEQLRQAQKMDEVRRKRVAAEDDANRAAVLDEMRSLDAAVTEARERLRRYEAAAHAAQAQADKAAGIAEDAEARRDAVRSSACWAVVVGGATCAVHEAGLRFYGSPGCTVVGPLVSPRPGCGER